MSFLRNLLLSAACLALVPTAVLAQGACPNKPVK